MSDSLEQPSLLKDVPSFATGGTTTPIVNKPRGGMTMAKPGRTRGDWAADHEYILGPNYCVAVTVSVPGRSVEEEYANAHLLADAPRLKRVCRQQAETIRKLREALESLMAEQNGPPLIRSQRQWEAAMAAARDALAEKEAGK